MWDRVEEVVNDIRPLINSVGVDARVLDVIDRTVTLQLVRTDTDSNPDLVRLRTFVSREIQSELPDVKDVVYEGDLAGTAAPAPARAFTCEPPPPEADTVVLSFTHPVAPPATSVYDDLKTASDRPVILAILRVKGVVSVIGRADKLIVARAAEATWDDLLPAIDAAVAEASAGTGDSDSEAGIRARVEAILERDINPAVAAHGGYIELLDVKGADLYIHMGGGCQGCAQSQATLRQGVEAQLRQAVPEISAIYDTTDHAAGTNPYFRA